MIKKIKKLIKRFILFKPEKKQNSINFLSDLTPISKTAKNDVFIVGFPKSGNTLMQHIMAHLVYDLNKNGSRSLISLLTPDVYTNTHYFRFNDTCFFKSHELPKEQYKKVIYIMRDGREALLSYYHMIKNMGKDILLEDLYSGKHKIFGVNWFEHIEKWEANPYDADILWLKYEDFKIDKKEVLKRICVFLNIERTEFELDRVVKYTSFDHMKDLEQQTDWNNIKENKFLKGRHFVRKGEIDSFKQEVPQNLISVFETINKSVIDKYYKK